MKLLKEYIRQFIQESRVTATVNHLGVVTRDFNRRRIGVIYDTRMLPKVPHLLLRLDKEFNSLKESICDNVIKGMIDVGPEGGGGCNGAWMVFRSAGPGMGKIVYSVGYALTPNGRLMSDRLSVSPSANNGWRSAYNKSEYKKLSLDDENAHNPDGTIKYDHPNHTEDPSDDCAMYRGKNGDEPPEKYPHLQYSYEGTGEEQTLLSTMQDNNEATLKEFFPGREHEVENLIRSSGELYFSMHYDT